MSLISKKTNPPWVVQAYRSPWYYRFIVATTVLVFLLSTFLSYQLGYQQAHQKFSDKIQSFEQLQQVFAELKMQKENLQQDIMRMEVSKRIDQVAVEQVRQDNLNLTQTNVALEKQLSFYKALMEPKDSKKGLNIEEWQVVKHANVLRYKILLTQISNQHRTLEGNVSVTIEGVSAEEEQTLSLAKLTTEAKPLTFKFKYFQTLEGEFNLPDSFEPKIVLVSAKTKGRKSQKRDITYSWNIEET